MEKTIDTKKNVTLSFKTTSEEKTALQQIANEKNITRSELIASLLYAYKHNYDQIGKASPIEVELKSKLETANKEKRKFILALENAENRIELEQKANRKYVKEQFELNKTIFDLEEELKITNSEIDRLNKALNVNQSIEQDSMDSTLLIGSLSSLLISGLTLLLMPRVFNN